jgi:uncharacterized protein YciI
MLFAVLFEDDPSHAESRKRLMAEHLAFLQNNAAAIKAAGPLVAEGRSGFTGGLWLVEASSREQVWRHCEDDPLRTSGLRKSVQIFEWKQVFADGTRLIEEIAP